MDTLPYVAVSVGLSISAIIVAIRLVWLHPVPVVKAGALDVTAAAFWLLTSGLGLTSSSLSVKFLIYQIGFFGIVLVEPCWLALSMIISGYERFVNRRNILALSVMPIITLALVFTNGYHGLIFSKVELNPADPMLPFSLAPGLAFGVIVVAYSYVLDAAGIVVLVKRLFVSRRSFRPQIYLLLAASVIPWLFNMLYLYDQNLFGYVEPTSLALTVAGAIVMWRTAHWSGLYIAPIAHEVMIDSMNDPVIVLDYERRVVDVNPVAEKLICRSYSEIMGQPIESTWPEWQRVSKVLDDKTSATKEVSFGTGEEKQYYELEKTRLPGFTSDEINLLITLRDITERKMMENDLRLHSEQLKAYSEHLEDLVEARTADLGASERKYRLLLDNMADAVFTIDLQGNLTFASQQTGKMTGYPIQQLLSMNIKELIASEDLSAIMKRLEARSRGETGLVPMQFDLVRADGTRLPIEIHTTLLTEGNKPVGVQGVARDVTERKRMEDALKESEARFRELADLLPQIVFETDEKGTLTFFNRVGLSSTGYTEEDLRKGFNAFQAFPPEDAMRALEKMQKVMRGEQMGLDEYNLLKKDGTSIPITIYSSAIIREGKPVGLRGIIVDMTERKQMEEKLLKSRHLAAVGETAAMVGHDLRNPLQGIMGAAYVLKTCEDNLGEQGKKMLHLIEDAIQRSDKIINDLLTYSKELELDLSTSNAKSLIEQSLASMKIPENINVVNHTKEQPRVEVDVEKMKRVCLNLMKNAVDAMPNGGTLTITNAEVDGNLLVSFADTGVGIRPEVLAKIWSPLFTTKAMGMGYGLPIVKRFMEAHGGSVTVETNPGKGSTFTIRIPIDRTANTSMEPQTKEIVAT